MIMLIAYTMVLHFVADFLLQSREMGKKKSTELKWLLKHLGITFAVFSVGLLPFLGAWAFGFAIANACFHGIIDWNIWNIYKYSAHVRIMKEVETLRKITVVHPEIDNEALLEDDYNEKVANWKFWEDHWFYATIGLDQLLHMLTIILLLGVYR